MSGQKRMIKQSSFYDKNSLKLSIYRFYDILHLVYHSESILYLRGHNKNVICGNFNILLYL